MGETASAYGLWLLVFVNSAVFILFAFSFFKPRTKRDWRSFGAFSAFVVALFTKMYGFPLTIYLVSGWLQSRYPGIDWFSHDAGHLLEMLFGWKANPHFGPFHVLSFALIAGGFMVIAAAWKVLYDAQQHNSWRRLVLTPMSDTRNTWALFWSWRVFLRSGRPFSHWPCSPYWFGCMSPWQGGKSATQSRRLATTIVNI